MAKTCASCAPVSLSPSNVPVRSGFDLNWLRHYVQVSKPGIVLGNLVSVMGGFFLASRGSVNGILFALTILGVSMVVASGCVFNNIIDRDIDQKMRRTQKRVLANGLIPVRHAFLYGFGLGVSGLALLYCANALSALLGVIGLFIYVAIYSLYLKRRSVYQTWIGSLSGAMPPVIGYCAVRGTFDLGAALLLLIFSLWQIPHSYAIAIVYRDDYAAAGVPVLPVLRGLGAARRSILYYIPVYTAAALMLAFFGYTGMAYAVVVGFMGAGWLCMGLIAPRASNDRAWAYQMFTFSIIAITTLSLMMALNNH